MMGSTAPFDYIHNFWSDQYEHTLQYVGHATRWDDFAVRGNLAEGKFIGFYLVEGVIRAAIGFDRGGDPEYEPDSEMAACARLVARRARPDPRVLTDEHADLSVTGAVTAARRRAGHGPGQAGSGQVAGVVDAADRRELVIMPLDLVDAG